MNADGGDAYTGFDRFGRVIDQYWRTNLASGHVDRERLQHAYDAGGNVLYAENLRAPSRSSLFHVAQASASGPESAYDSLGRLRQFSMGQLSR